MALFGRTSIRTSRCNLRYQELIGQENERMTNECRICADLETSQPTRQFARLTRVPIHMRHYKGRDSHSLGFIFSYSLHTLWTVFRNTP